MNNSLYPKYYLDMAPNGDGYGGGDGSDAAPSKGASQDVTDTGGYISDMTSTPLSPGLPAHGGTGSPIVGKYYCNDSPSQGNSCVEIIDANDPIYSIPGHPPYPAINQVWIPGVPSKMSVSSYYNAIASIPPSQVKTLYNSQSECEIDCSNHYPWNCWTYNNGSTAVGTNSFYHLTSSQKEGFCENCHYDTAIDITKIHPYCWCINPQTGGIQPQQGSIWTRPPYVYTCNAGPKLKKIRSVKIEKEEKSISPRGEVRNIDIYGDGGAVFTLTFKDSSDCTILKDEIENVKIPSSGNYSFKQKFPALESGTSETYNITINAAAGSSLDGFIDNQPPNLTLYQYKDPTISFTYTASTAHDPIGGSTLTISGGDVACSSTVGYSGDYSKTSTTNLTSGSVNAIYAYGKPSFSDCISSSTAIKKIAKRDEDDMDSYSRLKLAPSTTRTEEDGTITGGLKGGMRFNGKVSHEKIVTKSIDEDGEIISGNCSKLTNRFKLSDNHKLFEGMSVWKGDVFISEIMSVGEGEGCDPLTDITLTSEHIIRDDTVLRFEWLVGGTVDSVPSGETIDRTRPRVNDDLVGCEDEVELVGAMYIPNGTELTFDDNETVVNGRITVEKSGFAGVSPTTTAGTMSVTTYITVLQFGITDVTYTIDLDKFITKRPVAYDQEVVAPKNTTADPTSTTIYPKLYDEDANAATKTCAVFTNPRHGTVSAYDADLHTITYTPYTDFVGEDSFGFRSNDGTNPSDEKTIYITVK